MLYWIALVLATVVSIQALRFHNLNLSDKPYYEPCAIKINGTYYLVAITQDISTGIIPIHTSNDLVHWKLAGYVFDGSNIPTWADKTSFRSPIIHQIGATFVVYFSAYGTSGPFQNIGAAIASHPLGPYSAQDEPMVAMPHQQSWFPSIINDEEKLYLVWSNETYPIIARQLHADGLSFSSAKTMTHFMPTLEEESNFIYRPFFLQRGPHHLLFFDSAPDGIGVARSSRALGPYKRFQSPIIVSRHGYSNLLKVSVVPDLNDKKLILFLQANKNRSSVVVSVLLRWSKVR